MQTQIYIDSLFFNNYIQFLCDTNKYSTKTKCLNITITQEIPINHFFTPREPTTPI